MWRPRLIESARMKYLGIVEALEADIKSVGFHAVKDCRRSEPSLRRSVSI